MSNSSAEKPILPLGKRNYIIIGAGAVLVLLGFLLMYVGEEGRGKAEVIYSFSKTTLPVLLIMLGFGFTGYGIMAKNKKEEV